MIDGMDRHAPQHHRPSMASRLGWIVRHVTSQWWDMEVTRPREVAMKSVVDGLQEEFPSPRGVPVFEGEIRGSDPVRLRIRVFPHGARVGMMRLATRERPIKPTLVGTLTDGPGNGTLTYAVTSRTPALVALGSAVLAVVLLIVALAATTTTTWVIALVAALCLGGLFASYLAGVPKAQEEEQLLSEWVAEMFGSSAPV